MTPKDSDLLPGASGPNTTAPRANYKPHEQLRQARRSASIHDAIDTIIFVAVDALFLLWPRAHIPFLSRRASLLILLIANISLIGFWIRTRWLPRWRAKRISETWTEEERSRFGTTRQPDRSDRKNRS
ncbi:MAG TPA: hypothetical protein VNM92_11000 [Thermoanaerobaculia bacterium]|nr:hypothetical protein [Thermoanaerobaculia bacterium]